MSFLAFLIGIGLPTLSGWLIVSVLEGKKRVLYAAERLFLAFALGLIFTMYLTFVVSAYFHLPLTLIGFLSIQGIVLAVAATIWKLRARDLSPASHPPLYQSLSGPTKIAVVVLGLWTLLKIAAGGYDLLMTPAFFNDTVTNWNIRAKVFDHEDALHLPLPSDKVGEPLGGISSYPPAVPLAKTWLTTLNGEWSEGLANSLHLLWFLTLLGLTFFTLRRHTAFLAALLGMYLLSSLPFLLIHGTAAYADVFMALHLLIPLSLLYHAFTSEDRLDALAFLRLAAFAIALVPFTKNEGLLLFTPPLVLFFAFTLWSLSRRSLLSLRDLAQLLLLIGGSFALFFLPWLVFKWMNGLTFGNAKPIGGMELTWQPGVLRSIVGSLFLQGSWLLLFPLVLFLLAIRWKHAFFSQIGFLTIFFLLLFFGQLSIFLFTGLSVEAMKQTGFNRGIVHLAPIAVILISLLFAPRHIGAAK